MKTIKNTLYIQSDDIYLSLDGGNVVAKSGDVEKGRFPLSMFCDIITFSYKGASPALMGYCAENRIGLAFCNPNGRFLARVAGPVVGNILLRREQYRVADDPCAYMKVSRSMITGKLHNQRAVVERTKRNHGLRVDTDRLEAASCALREYAREAKSCGDPGTLRGIEGLGAKAYFDVFDEMILNGKDVFLFASRNRRPPLDPVNAMLSFGYSVLANDCASALESFGLDAYAGFLHRDKPARKSLALDLMEEFRPIFVDRFVLSLINNRQVSKSDFTFMDSGAVLLSEDGRKTFFREWQERKKDVVVHPYLGEKVQFGLLPYLQAQLLSRYLRGDIDGYPPVFWH